MKAKPSIRRMAFAAAHVALCSFASGVPVPTAQQREELLRPVDSVADPFAWWMPDGSRRGTNAVLEKAFGWGEGDAVRALERLLKEELAEPEGGDPDAVARILDAIRLSGDMSVTNTLDGLLFSDAGPLRPELFCVRTSFCGLDHWEFAKRFVNSIPSKTRRLCYASAAPLIDTAMGERVTQRAWQAFMVLQSCAVEETDAALAEQLDRILTQNRTKHTFWSARSARQHLAARFAEASGAAGLYFKEIAEEFGSPAPPKKKDMMIKLLSLDGDPPDILARKQKDFNVMFAQDYGMEERDVVRLLERTFMKTLEDRDESDEATFFRGYALAGIYRCNDPLSTNMLVQALKADWNPSRFNVFQNYLHNAGLDGLPICLNVLSDLPKFEAGTRGICYEQVAELAKGRDVPKDTLAEITAFLRGAIMRDSDNTVWLDGIISSVDSGWARSGERKKLADRLASGQEGNEYMRG
ncbi:MAG: hypothetical protein WC328_17460, partial [Kiritimatiellia bacterium]